MKARLSRVLVAPLLAPLLAIVACYDPVHLDAIAVLGPEAPGIPEGPLHRPGDPCTTCHGGRGPAELDLSIAGTLFKTRGSKVPETRGLVTVTDVLGESRTLRTNEAGNFFIARSDWDPGFPLTIVVEADGQRRAMITTIGRDGGCAACHRDPGGVNRMPGVFVRESP